VLSHRPHQPLQHLGFAHTPAFDQARHSRHIADDAGWKFRGFGDRRIGLGAYSTVGPFAVLHLLLRFAFGGGVVGDAALSRTSLAMRLPAAKGTPQVAPSGVAGMGQKENPAMLATAQTAPQIGSAAQYGPQHDVILLHQPTGFALVVPIRTELEKRLDLDYDKPRVSLIMLVLFDMSLSYPIDAPVSRG